MLKSLARKEIHELLPLAAGGVLLQLYVVSAAMGMRLGLIERNSIGDIPFVQDSMSGWFFFAAGGLALALGWWQTLLESTRGTFQFLLHRPLAREAIFGTKLAVGFLITLALSFLPVAAYALWAASPGTHPSPFEWSMTINDWQWACQMPILYLGAFLSGLRPGRWFGSRLFPLAGAVAAMTVCQMLSGWWWAELLASLATMGCFVNVILYVGRTRDFS
jgi:hypothetical protein